MSPMFHGGDRALSALQEARIELRKLRVDIQVIVSERDTAVANANAYELALRNVFVLVQRMKRTEIPGALDHLIRFCVEAIPELGKPNILRDEPAEYDPCDPDSGIADAGGIDGRHTGEVKGL